MSHKNIKQIPNLEILVVTLSDRAYSGEYDDRSGPIIQKTVEEYFAEKNWKFQVKTKLIPDSAENLELIITDAKNKYNIIFTTGGTGIGPRDITVDTIKPMLKMEIPGIMELIRVKYGQNIPNAILSRSIAGIVGKSLIYTLPGSVKAVKEYMYEINKTLEHLLFMQYGVDVH
ncbi:MAG: MogA/MoaB family molybdenum cofactor biosynthesis protein [Bacteroidetes bacterium]|jgi:molybdopterin adenylyltransferase|nr:MogA/MoaB family molybdenum cofactor biosynthesis protein [Bacteroidota bacterium]MBT6687588.1 MogA/MoaB family molybdenum cofactor biosynthesis protein [Bacteroidota bacterium]MBT7143587.1 MogA/MoaB family molybdenum cofactor biosynthesis protein [Bacteroidota bacterium]MBT7492183.1 MogA/MoaB family molybdenum cofactor biosynthesis protein [Bacteroidota bacterium]